MFAAMVPSAGTLLRPAPHPAAAAAVGSWAEHETTPPRPRPPGGHSGTGSRRSVGQRTVTAVVLPRPRKRRPSRCGSGRAAAAYYAAPSRIKRRPHARLGPSESARKLESEET